jgi:hypothetical protein
VMEQGISDWKNFIKSNILKFGKNCVIYYEFTEYDKKILRLLNAQEGEEILECEIGIG